TAKFEADQQRANSLERGFQLAKIGPRVEEIARAKGAMIQAEGQEAYAKSLLDATLIRAPVTGTILERTAERGELVTSQFASQAEVSGRRGKKGRLPAIRGVRPNYSVARSRWEESRFHRL